MVLVYSNNKMYCLSSREDRSLVDYQYLSIPLHCELILFLCFICCHVFLSDFSSSFFFSCPISYVALSVFHHILNQLFCAFRAYFRLEDIQYTFPDWIVSLVQAQYYFEDSFSPSDKKTLQSLFTAYSLVDDKVDKCLSEEGQPGLQFLKDVQFFVLRKL